MIIHAWFMDKEVLLEVDESMLVFDGNNYVSVSEAEYVALYVPTRVQLKLPNEVYPIQLSPTGSEDYTLNNRWVCKVIRVTGGSLEDVPDVVQVVDPTDGRCICGVTCQGTEFVDVNVYSI